MPWRGPNYPGEQPTLGYGVLNWISANLAAPDRSEYEPLVLTNEQAQFVLNFYVIDPLTQRRRYRRGVLSRPKGWGKSPLLGALACAEALGPVVFDGWDAKGEPVGKKWVTVRTPWIQLAAVSEDQTRNAWAPLLEMLREGPIANLSGLEPMETFVNLPKGRIEFVTSSATSREGNRPVFAVLDQTEEWKTGNGGIKLAATIRRNLGKTNGTSIESPNAYEPGAGSVAEASAEYASKIAEGRTKDRGLLWDHREAPPETNPSNRDSLLAGLTFAYGDSAESAGGWVDLERIMAEVNDLGTEAQDSRRFYLNQITHSKDAWLSQPEWASCIDLDKLVADRDTITLGFDGSRGRSRGVTDATALIGCRVSDGHLFEVGLWEQPNGPAGEGWTVPLTEVNSAVHGAFDRYNVVGLYADPAGWTETISAWEAKYVRRLKAKVNASNPMFWWMAGGRSSLSARALDQFQRAVVDGQLTHAGDYGLTRHILNARCRPNRFGARIDKDFPDSPRKIDAAIAATLAYQARVDALAKGGAGEMFVPRRIR